jgi:hypothetical protein
MVSLSPASSSLSADPAPRAEGQLSEIPQVCSDSSRQPLPTNTSGSAITEDIKKSNGTLVPALRRVHPVVTRILRRLESMPAPPGPPPELPLTP